MIKALVKTSNSIEQLIGSILDKLTGKIVAEFKKTSVYGYWMEIYAEPYPSERVLGRFFFYKTTLTMTIAYYSDAVFPLVFILAFSTGFDALTGVYQHTIMNFCHRTILKSRIGHAIENLARRFVIDVIRAEGVSILALGWSVLALESQGHILINRLSSGTYYFNAFLLDKLVSSGAVCRNKRSKFIIVFSTIGGLFSMLHLARTQPPHWFPATLTNTFESFPSALTMLLGFNFAVFVFMAVIYVGHNAKKAVRI